MKELSLRPYTGRLFIARTKAEYERGHKELFDEPDVLTCSKKGTFTGGKGKDGFWTYLIYARTPDVLAHELCHCLFHVFENINADPRQCSEEPFCYMLSQLMIDARSK